MTCLEKVFSRLASQTPIMTSTGDDDVAFVRHVCQRPWVHVTDTRSPSRCRALSNVILRSNPVDTQVDCHSARGPIIR